MGQTSVAARSRCVHENERYLSIEFDKKRQGQEEEEEEEEGGKNRIVAHSKEVAIKTGMAILFYEIRRKNVSVAYAAPVELLHKTLPSQLVE